MDELVFSLWLKVAKHVYRVEKENVIVLLISKKRFVNSIYLPTGLTVRLKIVLFPTEVKAIPLGMKRCRGHAAKKMVFIVQWK